MGANGFRRALTPPRASLALGAFTAVEVAAGVPAHGPRARPARVVRRRAASDRRVVAAVGLVIARRQPVEPDRLDAARRLRRSSRSMPSRSSTRCSTTTSMAAACRSAASRSPRAVLGVPASCCSASPSRSSPTAASLRGAGGSRCSSTSPRASGSAASGRCRRRRSTSAQGSTSTTSGIISASQKGFASAHAADWLGSPHR